MLALPDICVGSDVVRGRVNESGMLPHTLAKNRFPSTDPFQLSPYCLMMCELICQRLSVFHFVSVNAFAVSALIG